MSSEQELEEQLKEEADSLIERLLADRKPAGENSLKDIEQMAIRVGQEFRERVLHYLAHEESQAAAEPVCGGCGRRMRSRGKRVRQVVTEAGEVKVERGYYVCPGCGQKAFPPG
jgi:tRNA(Ile2) C34 agmatinyltransferase TiaS